LFLPLLELKAAPHAGAMLERSNAVAIFVRHVTNDGRAECGDESSSTRGECPDTAGVAATRFRNTDAMTEIRIAGRRRRATSSVGFEADFGDYEARRWCG
jgi:hypothetical protein